MTHIGLGRGNDVKEANTTTLQGLRHARPPPWLDYFSSHTKSTKWARFEKCELLKRSLHFRVWPPASWRMLGSELSSWSHEASFSGEPPG